MTSIRRRSRDHVRTFLLAGTLVLAAGCATPPEMRGQSGQDEAAPAPECAQLQGEIAQTEKARSAAAERSGNAWKAVVPVVVLAQKASGTAAVHEAERKLAALKVQAGRCEAS
jgi:hypothetical protein